VGPFDLALAALLLIGGALVVRDTLRRRGRWGINLRQVSCPRCASPMPRVRAPATGSQAMWGGSTCTCGCRVDKWGHEIA
jgi:hypothetical protein